MGFVASTCTAPPCVGLTTQCHWLSSRRSALRLPATARGAVGRSGCAPITACPLVPWNAKLPTPHLIPPRAGTSAAALLCRPAEYRRKLNSKATVKEILKTYYSFKR